MKLWIFSDLHLREASDSLYRSLIMTLDEPKNENDTVVFAGDIFDLYLGDHEQFFTENKHFFDKIKILNEQKVNLYYIEGNHDFHLAEVLKPYGVKLIENEMVISTPKKIYIAHGDLVDQEDVGYLRLRSFFRTPVMRFLIQSVPVKVIEFIAKKLSRQPQQQQAELPEHWPKADLDRLRKKFRSFAEQKKAQGIDYIVLGHCHDLDETVPFYFNMGYPPVHRQFLVYDSTEDRLKRREFVKNT